MTTGMFNINIKTIEKNVAAFQSSCDVYSYFRKQKRLELTVYATEERKHEPPSSETGTEKSINSFMELNLHRNLIYHAEDDVLSSPRIIGFQE